MTCSLQLSRHTAAKETDLLQGQMPSSSTSKRYAVSVKKMLKAQLEEYKVWTYRQHTGRQTKT